MVAIERTAYPRFKRAPTAKELAEVYSLTDDERRFARATARSDRLRLSLAVLLKAFGRLGDFPSLADVPAVIVGHLRGSLGLPAEVRPGYDEMRTLYRHHQAIRTFLEVRPYGPAALHVAVTAVHRAATVKDHAADLLNIAIEELVRQRYELPAFSTLDRLVGHIRAQVNRRLFHQVLSHLTDQEQRRLDELLVADHVQRRSLLGELKAPPKSATLQHLQELQNRLVWLLSLGEVERPLSGLAPAKIAHFAAEAGVLDADGLQDMAPPKRYTLLLCLIHHACALIAAAGGNNYLPLLWRFYQSHRQALVRLARALELHPTTQDRSVLDALEIVLDHERSRREWLPITLDLSFASEQWRRTVLAERDGQLGVLRRQLEVCVFSSLASELRTGDVFVVGSEGYADYREQLLPWARCEPQVAAYCQELGFPETARGFVERLQHWLTRAAEEVDRAYPENGQLVISDKGEPVLKRPPISRRSPPSPRWKPPSPSGSPSGVCSTCWPTWSTGCIGPATSAHSQGPNRSWTTPCCATS